MDAPLPAADVRKPARSEWPENALASNPARLAYALTIFATDRSVSLESRTVSALSTGRKIGPAAMPAASNHSRSALTGQAMSPRAIAIITNSPVSASSISATSSATSSERRKAPPNPIRSNARSLRHASLSGAAAITCRSFLHLQGGAIEGRHHGLHQPVLGNVGVRTFVWFCEKGSRRNPVRRKRTSNQRALDHLEIESV